MQRNAILLNFSSSTPSTTAPLTTTAQAPATTACAVVVNGAVVEGVEELKLSSIDINDDVHDIGSFRSPRIHHRCSRCLCGRSQWSRGGGR